MPETPNILFLITDQQRYDTIAALGNGVIRTPNLDRLAREGTSFRNAYTVSPECVPARCCFTHGQYPGQTQCYGNGSHFPTDGRENLMEALSRADYYTHGIGKYHFEYADYDRVFANNGFETREIQEEIVDKPERDDYLKFLRDAGFTEVTDPHGIRGEMYYMPQPAMMPQKYHPTQWVGDRGEAFMQGTRDEQRPWYGYISFIHPHPPFAPPSPWHKLYRDLDMPLPHLPPDCEKNWIYVNRYQNRYKRFDRGLDLNRVRMMRSYYYACISFLDYQVGRVLDALDATGQAENTLVVFTSDHGELLGDFNCVGKRSYHDPASRIPMMLRWPGSVPQGKVSETPVSLLDVTRTFLETAGTQFETHSCDGENLVNQANAADTDRTLFSQLYSAERGLYTAVNRQWKYVYSAPDNRELLFNRVTDPGETVDMADRGFGWPLPGAEAQAKMKTALITHLKEVGEESAVEGDDWKVYPKSELQPNPNADLLYQDHPWAGEIQDITGYSAAPD